jgi:hypothetical protein
MRSIADRYHGYLPCGTHAESANTAIKRHKPTVPTRTINRCGVGYRGVNNSQGGRGLYGEGVIRRE